MIAVSGTCTDRISRPLPREVAYGLREKGPAEDTGLIYSRLNNPDLEVLEDRLTLWDGAEAAASFQSGMAAISTSLLTFVRPGPP